MTKEEKLIIEAVVEMLNSTLWNMPWSSADAIVARACKILHWTFL